ncbi:MAG: mannose-1-phosphate guanylyltransferase [Planctomycetia bacterium]|nr:mannose-1-phosphate guanylyltransferase [Planctomycetia bacterium]
MAGGSGTRFWPRSRRRMPKQFLKFGSERTLLQETAERCRPLISAERTWIVTGRDHAEEVGRQLNDVATSRVVIEPCGRNTAPCIGLAALMIHSSDPDGVMLVMPSDHVIRPAAEFQAAVQTAVGLIEQLSNRLVLFGVPPTYPATGFGYIHRGELLTVDDSSEQFCRTSAFHVAEFREKPDATTAANYLASGEYFWNCGIFVWRAATILKAIEQHAPDVNARLNALRPAIGTAQWSEILCAEFPRMPSISIDYAVLEKAAEVCVLPATFEWDDVGSWQAMTRLLPQDEAQNTVDGPFCSVNTNGCVVATSNDHLIATYGVRDLIIVHTPTVTLVADKHDESAMRQLVAELERRGLSEYL